MIQKNKDHGTSEHNTRNFICKNKSRYSDYLSKAITEFFSTVDKILMCTVFNKFREICHGVTISQK